jgi:hypothetical protein
MRARTTALMLGAVLIFYLVLVGQRGVWLLTRGRPLLDVFGVAVLIVPLIGVWFLVREVRFGAATARLARELEADDQLPQDELPRRPSGRVDLAAADEIFAGRRAETEAAPDDWRPWYRLAVAYSDARDTPRARRAMRHAIALHDEPR